MKVDEDQAEHVDVWFFGIRQKPPRKSMRIRQMVDVTHERIRQNVIQNVVSC